MDEQLQAKIDEAKAAGYSDEEIQNFLATKDQPIGQEQPLDRSGDYGATAMAAIPTVLELGAAGYGIKKVADAFRGGPSATPQAQPGSGADMLKQFSTPKGPVAPPANPAMSPSYAAPAAQAPAQAAPSMIERGTQYARQMQQIAAEKVMQGARAAAPMAQAAAGAARVAAPAAIGLGAMMFPSSTGPAVPQSGPMRGMEINPNTGRPWTPEELAQLR